MKINIRFSGRQYHLGDQFPESLSLPDKATVADALVALTSELADPSRLSSACLVILDGKHVGTMAETIRIPVEDGCELMLLAPVAGG